MYIIRTYNDSSCNTRRFACDLCELVAHRADGLVLSLQKIARFA